MFKIYMRLLGFARPIRKYAIPYFFYSLFYALFNSLTFLLIFVVGVNKIVHDLDAALKRARQAASPNASRLNSPVPCGRTGFCVDCKVPERMCRVISILERCPMGREAHVIIVLQNLGY